MGWVEATVANLAPLFIVLSPIISYSDQAVSMHRNKSSAGFSLDITLIMLVASFLRVFYWPGAHFDASLLIQSIVMIFMQAALLKVGLDHRPLPSTKGGEASLPFASLQQASMWESRRPYNFWQWRSPKPYWQFLLYLFLGLLACELVLGQMPLVYSAYSVMIGYLGLMIEATLPLPQVWSNLQTKSCKGLRLSVLVSWLAGDAMKMFWFFTATTAIPPAFKICGVFQALCDCTVAVQVYMYSRPVASATPGYAMTEAAWTVPPHPVGSSISRSPTPTRRSKTFNDADGEL